jgi:hypothetical protein
MPRLAKALSGGRSRDIITDERFAIIDEPQEKEPEQANGPVKTTLDLSLFKRFDVKSQSLRGRHDGKWFRVDQKGNITLTDALSREFSDDAKVAIYLNSKGNILVMREEPDGIQLTKMYKTTPRSVMRRCTCREIARTLEQIGVKLPVRFMAEWDEELGAWVGRRENG